MRASILAALMALAAVAVAAGLLFALFYSSMSWAHAHEMMGTHDGQFLWGRFIGDPPEGGKRNCCREGGDGDCQRLDPNTVKIVPGGFEWDGEFIAFRDANISPIDPITGESGWYGCKHPKGHYNYTGKAHCFFYPASGS